MVKLLGANLKLTLLTHQEGFRHSFCTLVRYKIITWLFHESLHIKFSRDEEFFENTGRARFEPYLNQKLGHISDFKAPPIATGGHQSF
jgi:hypothetical protein